MPRDRMANSHHKWLLPGEPAPPRDVRAYWDRAHNSAKYQTTFSVGDDDGVRLAIAGQIERSPSHARVLLAGCGSRTAMQEHILACFKDMHVIATDYASVIRLARERFQHPRLEYAALEEDGLERGSFDLLVAVNVLVMSTDIANRELMGAWAEMLKPGGCLIALVPYLYCGHELATLSSSSELRQCLDLERSTWTERRQGCSEVEYAPLRLRRIVKEAGLELRELSIVFLESPSSRRQAREHYGLHDEDLLVYELLLTAQLEPHPGGRFNNVE
jgi:SAM-dependent methyltransferase